MQLKTTFDKNLENNMKVFFIIKKSKLLFLVNFLAFYCVFLSK